MRVLSSLQIGTQNQALGGAGVVLCTKQFQRGTGMEVPYLGRINTVPMAALALFQKEENSSTCRARTRISRGNPCLTIPPPFRVRRQGETLNNLVSRHISPFFAPAFIKVALLDRVLCKFEYRFHSSEYVCRQMAFDLMAAVQHAHGWHFSLA